jgi:thiol-disulfide isomerase/thioredoxin
MKNSLIFIVAIVLAAAAGYVAQNYVSQSRQAENRQSNPVIGTQRPEFAMPDIDGQIRNIKDWDGKVVLLNFWATWCPPCKKEIPTFIELQKEYGEQGLQIVGVAMDNVEDVSAYALEMDINYPLMAGEQESIELARRYGNSIGALPFTVVIDRNGLISSTFAGEMSKSHALKSLQDAGLSI